MNMVTRKCMIIEKSAKVYMRFTTVHKLIISISKGKIPEKYYFAS